MLVGLEKSRQAWKSPRGASISVCTSTRNFASWPAIAQWFLIFVSGFSFLLSVVQTSAHQEADATQVPRDEYDKFAQAYLAKRDSDKQSLALAALVAVAGEPESELEGSQIEATVPVVKAGRSSSVPTHTGEPIKQAAHAVATGRLQEEIAFILAGKQEKPSRELINAVKQILKLVLKQGTFVVYVHMVSEMQDGQHRPLARSCKRSSWSGGRKKAAIRRASWASARHGRAPSSMHLCAP